MIAFIKRLWKIGIVMLLTVAFFVFAANLWVYHSTKDAVYDSLENAPDKDIALVLGTSPKLMTGDPNPYFHERVEFAALLLKKGKVKHILVSGDNRTKYYNEPIKMYNALLELGVEKKDINIDYAGLRTLDSIVRCKEIFGQDDIAIITQPFHSPRALFISKFYNINAISYSITEIPSDFSYKVKTREYLARALAVLDLYIFDRSPKFLGEKEVIDI